MPERPAGTCHVEAATRAPKYPARSSSSGSPGSANNPSWANCHKHTPNIARLDDAGVTAVPGSPNLALEHVFRAVPLNGLLRIERPSWIFAAPVAALYMQGPAGPFSMRTNQPSSIHKRDLKALQT